MCYLCICRWWSIIIHIIIHWCICQVSHITCVFIIIVIFIIQSDSATYTFMVSWWIWKYLKTSSQECSDKKYICKTCFNVFTISFFSMIAIHCTCNGNWIIPKHRNGACFQDYFQCFLCIQDNSEMSNLPRFGYMYVTGKRIYIRSYIK